MSPAAAIVAKPVPGTGLVRPFEVRDLPAVVRLHRRTFASRRMPPAELEAYLEQVFCAHPWRDETSPSLVFESRPGCVAGCLGVMPRPMTFRGRSITAAISHHFMVEPEQRGTLAALQLLRTFLGGSQQLSMAEGNERSRRMWEGLHATTVAAYSLHWLRLIRPAAYTTSLLQGRRLVRLGARLVAPLAAASDALVARAGWIRPARPVAGSLEPLTPLLLQASLERMRGSRALLPRYDPTAIAWLFTVLASKRSSGDLQAMLVRSAHGDVAGWFVYYLRRDGAGEVLQVAGRDRALGEVFDHLLWHAYQGGAAALTGRLEPALLPACAAQRCWLRAGRSWMLVHAASRDLIDALHAGDAFLSPLEGEWWMSS